MIVPHEAGGATDVVARLIANKLSNAFGQPVVVENKPGAAGITGADMVAKSPKDGYTISMFAATHAINATLFKKLPFDPVADFQPIAMAASYAYLFVVNKDFPAKSVKDFVDIAKAQPGKIAYASGAIGAPGHLGMEILANTLGLKLIHVPYKGSAGALRDLAAGTVPLMFDPIGSSLPLIRDGRIRALAVSSLERSKLLPDLPTMEEASGIKGFSIPSGWIGFWAPAGVPMDIITKFNGAINVALKEKDITDKLDSIGYKPEGGTPERYGQVLRTDIPIWGAVVKSSGTVMD